MSEANKEQVITISKLIFQYFFEIAIAVQYGGI
jgi:hypothetical protein